MDGIVRDRRDPNPHARASVLVAVLALAAIPAGVAVAQLLHGVTLLDAGLSIPVAVVLALLALALARRARLQVQRTIGRIGGEGLLRVGRALSLLALWIALTAAVALGFYGLLKLFAS